MSIRSSRIPLLHRAIAHHPRLRPHLHILQDQRHKAHKAQLNKLTPKARSKEGMVNTLHRRFMITTNSPSNTDYQDIISRVPRQNEKLKIAVNEQEEISVVILTTPSFTTWLENEDFISQLLSSILLPQKVSCIDYPTVNVVSAVVDRLPPPEHDGSLGKEGFSILYGSPTCVLPDHQKPSFPSSNQSSIRFSFNYPFKKPPYEVSVKGSTETSTEALPKSIILPLAKTIFRNGRESTLIASKWKKGGAETNFPYQKIFQSDKTSERIISLPAGGGFVPHAPLVALTFPRLIVSSMGNIVRQLKKHEDESIIPASQELEANVNAYFERLSLPPRTVSVWAVISEAAVNTCHANSSTLHQGWKGNFNRFLKFPNISRTATSVHRVLSGGGGWGLKQGLVSLDPQSEGDFLPNYEDELESQPGGISDIAPPGSSIQFFLTESPSSERIRKSWELRSTAHGRMPKYDQSLYLGTTPSSIDNVPDTSLGNSNGSKDDDTFRVYESHFGALSEQGIFLIQEDQNYRKIRSTKLDIPNSWIENYDTETS